MQKTPNCSDVACVDIGERCRGYWEAEEVWYPCLLLRVRERDSSAKVQWEDGTVSRVSLSHLKRCKKRKAKEIEVVAPPAPLELPPRHTKLPSHRFVMAPMVGGSELPFRMLARAAGAELCYTPMIYSGPFSSDAAYRSNPENGFQTCAADRPLVAHFCGNDQEVLLSAARHVVDQVDAIDLNLGCPQRVAHAGHFGSYLLDECDRELVCGIVRRLSDALPIPIFCKIRLLDDMESTLRLVRQLEASGASLLAVHARYRGSPTHRRDGPAHLDQVAVIKKHVRVPVLSNGNVRCWTDVESNLKLTGADGIMSAEGLLDDPCLFSGSEAAPDEGCAEIRRIEKKLRQIKALQERQSKGTKLAPEEIAKVDLHESLHRERQRLLDSQIGGTRSSRSSVDKKSPKLQDGLAKARRYLELAREYWMPPLSTVLFHLRRMAKQELTKYSLMEELMASTKLEAAEAVLSRAETCRDSPEGQGSFDKERAEQERKRREQRLYEEACRRKFEARMAKKAKREGKALSEVLRPTHVPGGVLSFGADPSWLLENNGG